jgi:hypothetical protein
MKPRINMITLGVQDLERATSFYEEGLGLPRKPYLTISSISNLPLIFL